MNPKYTTEEKYGYLKVVLNYAPKTNGNKFAQWCKDNGFSPLYGGRRAWSHSLSTYLRGASGIAHVGDQSFLFYEEDLVDLVSQQQSLLDEIEQRVIGEDLIDYGGQGQRPGAAFTIANDAKNDLRAKQRAALETIRKELG